MGVTNLDSLSLGEDLEIGGSISMETDRNTQNVVGLIRLKFDDGEIKNKAKAIIAYLDENDDEVIWLQTHDWLDDSTQHKHFSIEAADDDGHKQTRLGVGYGADVVDVTVNQADLKINRNTGETNGNIVLTGGGGGGTFKHAGTFSFYPNEASNASYAIQISLVNTNEPTISSLGANYVRFNDGILVNTGSGGDYSSLVRLAGESGTTHQGGYLQYDGVGNEFIIGTHNAADTSNASDVEVIRIARTGATTTVAGNWTFSGDNLAITTPKTPSSAADTGTVGQICWDANFMYVCVATNTWKRAAISTW